MCPPGRGSQWHTCPAAKQTTHQEEARQQSNDMAHKRIFILSRGDTHEAGSGTPCHVVNAKELFDPQGERKFSGLHVEITQQLVKHEHFEKLMRDIKTFIRAEAANNSKEMYLDICCCSRGKHRSLGLATIVPYMLKYHTTDIPEVQHYEIKVFHAAKSDWGYCYDNCCPVCISPSAEREEVMKQAAAIWVLL